MKNRKGFTLVELIAVIVIIGIVMLIAVPSVTSYIASSRKSAYVKSANSYIESVKRMITSRELSVKRKNATYYIPISCIPTEEGGNDSPYGDWKEAYVVVTYNGDKYEYYWTSYDESNMGIRLTHSSKLDEDRVKEGITSIATDIGILNSGETSTNTSRNKIIVVNAEEESLTGEDSYMKCVLPTDSNGEIVDTIANKYIEEEGEL